MTDVIGWLIANRIDALDLATAVDVIGERLELRP